MSGSVEINGYQSDWVAEDIAQRFESWDAGKQVWKKRVGEVIQYVYATSTRETANVENEWSHSTHIPKITQIHDNLGANYASALFSKREFFTFDPATPDEATAKKRQAIVNYLRTKHDYSGFNDTMKQLLNDWVQTGNCFAHVEYVRETAYDQSTGEEVVVYEGPRVNRISPYDIVFDFTAESFQKSPKMFRRLISRGDFARYVLERPDAGFDMERVEDVLNYYTSMSGYTDIDINKHNQQRMDGFDSYAAYLRSGKVELIEFIGDIWDSSTNTLMKDRLITVADRKFVVRNQGQDDFQGFGKIYHSSWRKRPDNLWGQGPLDNLVGMQYLINHLENARADAFDQMLFPDRVHVGNVQIEENGPVTNYYIDDGQGSVSNLAPDATVLQADLQIQIKEAQMEAFAGAPREAMGIRTAGEKTAFEIQQLQNAAGRLFQVKIEDFEREIIEPILNGELEVAVKNLSSADVAKVIDDDDGVIEFLTITKEDLTARGKLKARGASHFAKRAQLVQELQQFSLVLANDPEMKVHFPPKLRAKAWADALNFENMELFVPFGSVSEQLELNRTMQAAQNAQALTDAVEVPPEV